MKASPRSLRFVKGRHQYVFCYHQGQETELMASFVGLADDPASDFDWFDAAVLSFQMGRQVAQPVGAMVFSRSVFHDIEPAGGSLGG